jgi:hypothetical protein
VCCLEAAQLAVGGVCVLGVGCEGEERDGYWRVGIFLAWRCEGGCRQAFVNMLYANPVKE